jgi:hypothetical protein
VWGGLLPWRAPPPLVHKGLAVSQPYANSAV